MAPCPQRREEKRTPLSAVKRTADGTKWEISVPNNCTGLVIRKQGSFLDILNIIDHFLVGNTKATIKPPFKTFIFIHRLKEMIENGTINQH